MNRVRFLCQFERPSSLLPVLCYCLLRLPAPPVLGLSYRKGRFESGCVERIVYDADADEWRAYVAPGSSAALEGPRHRWFTACFEPCWRPLCAPRQRPGRKAPRGPRPLRI